MRTALVIVTAAILSLAGCATTGSSGSGGDRNLITSEEIREEDTGSRDLQSVIQRLRPRWLTSRSSDMRGQELGPVVYMDGSRRGGIEFLRSLLASDVSEVRYLSGPDATTRYGTGHVGGVILVSSRR